MKIGIGGGIGPVKVYVPLNGGKRQTAEESADLAQIGEELHEVILPWVFTWGILITLSVISLYLALAGVGNAAFWTIMLLPQIIGYWMKLRHSKGKTG